MAPGTERVRGAYPVVKPLYTALCNGVRRFLDFNSCHNAVRSLILSKLDYCGALLNGIFHKDITRLQRIQNRCARLIFKKPKRTHSSPLLQELHWLPVAQRIQFRTLVHTFKSLNNLSPHYISPASSMCASHLLTPSDPPLSLVFMFRRHALLLAIEHFHPLLLVYGTTSLPRSEALPPLPLSKSLLNIIFFPIRWFPFLLLLPFFLLSFLFL